MENTNEQELNWRPSRAELLDKMGRPMTQSLFLEVGYGSDAIYTLKDIDYQYQGKFYRSLKRLYLEVADPTEYLFANTYLLNMKQWIRIAENKALRKDVDEWRYELELKLRSEGVRQARKQAQGGSWQAAKWLSDKGWDVRPAGRPSKEDIQREKKMQADMYDEFEADRQRLQIIK